MNHNKKAFTLTELLVVVIVLGVLSAVAVPKFTRVLETRRTTEAEDMLSAVRAEQEVRCVMGRKYTGDLGKIQLAKNAKSVNYDLDLKEKGAIATRGDNKEYELRILYQNGEICCWGDGCDALNKSYPRCDSDWGNIADECAGEATNPGDNTEPTENACHTNPSTANCCTASEISAGKTWNGSSCVCAGGPECGGKCVSACWGGQVMQSDCTCACPEDRENVNGYCLVPCAQGEERASAYPYACEKTSACDASSKPDDFQTSCGACGKMTITYQCNESTGKWVSQGGTCVVPEGYSNDCSPGATQTKEENAVTYTRTCQSTCSWSDWAAEKTSCPSGYTDDGTGKCYKYNYYFKTQSNTYSVTCPANGSFTSIAQPGTCTTEKCDASSVNGLWCSGDQINYYLYNGSWVEAGKLHCSSSAGYIMCQPRVGSGLSGSNTSVTSCKSVTFPRQCVAERIYL